MKYIFTGVFALGMWAGIWTTGSPVSVGNIVAQKCGTDNTSQIVILGNLKLTNPLGKLTCGENSTLKKSTSIFNDSIDKINNKLDEVNKNVENNKTDFSKIDQIGYSYSE